MPAVHLQVPFTGRSGCGPLLPLLQKSLIDESDVETPAPLKFCLGCVQEQEIQALAQPEVELQGHAADLHALCQSFSLNSQSLYDGEDLRGRKSPRLLKKAPQLQEDP